MVSFISSLQLALNGISIWHVLGPFGLENDVILGNELADWLAGAAML